MEKNKTFIVRDLRQKSRYTIDDEYLNGYAKLCGVFGTAVYNSLCRHASRNQECFPSIELIAEQHNIGRKSVMNGLKNLKTWGIVEIIRERDSKTKRLKNNVYILLDKSQWKPKPSVSGAPGLDDNGLIDGVQDGIPSALQIPGNQEPSPCEGLGAKSLSGTDPSPCEAKSQVPVGDYKDTHNKDSHIRDDADASAHICSQNGCNEKKMKGVEFCEKHQPMSCQQFIDWYQKSDQRHIKIIADFVDELKIAGFAPDLRTVAQWREFVHPFRATAVKLSVFEDDQLASAMKRMMSAKWVTDFNLYTLKKFLINSNK